MWRVLLSACLLSSTLIALPTLADDKQPSVNEAEEDLIRLESRFIGDKEQPSVTYFVPWQGTDSPDDLKWKIERKNDDTLSLVDRNIMLRSMNIYNEMGLEPSGQ